MNLSARLRKIAGPRPWGWREPRKPSLTEWLAVAEAMELPRNANTKRMRELFEENGHGKTDPWSYYGYPDTLQAWIGGPCPTQPSPREGLVDPDDLRLHPRYVMLRATHRKQTTDFLCETSDVTDEEDLHPANFGKQGPAQLPLVPKHFLRDGGGRLDGATTMVRRSGDLMIRVSIVGSSNAEHEDYRDVRLQLHADAGHLANMYSRNSGLYSKIGGTLWKIFKPTAEAFLHAMASLGLPYQVVTEPKMATSYTARCVGVLGFYTQQQFEAIEAFARGKDAQALTDRIAYTLRDTLARDPTFTNMLREEPTIPGPPSE